MKSNHFLWFTSQVLRQVSGQGGNCLTRAGWLTQSPRHHLTCPGIWLPQRLLNCMQINTLRDELGPITDGTHKWLANKINFSIPSLHQIMQIKVIPYNISRKVSHDWATTCFSYKAVTTWYLISLLIYSFIFSYFPFSENSHPNKELSSVLPQSSTF